MSLHKYMKVQESNSAPDMEAVAPSGGLLPSTDSSQQLMTDSVSLDSNGSRRRNSRDYAGFGGISASEWFTVLVLCFVNLINYMDRFTIAEMYRYEDPTTRSVAITTTRPTTTRSTTTRSTTTTRPATQSTRLSYTTMPTISTTMTTSTSLRTPNVDCPDVYIGDWSEQLGAPVHWPGSNYSSANVLSEPLCLNQHKQLNVKKCVMGKGWQPVQVHCDHNQPSYEQANKCPHEYHEFTDDLCVMVTPTKQPWKSVCDDSLASFTIFNMTHPELVILFDYLRNKAPKSDLYWLPAKQTHKDSSLKIGRTYSLDEIGIQWELPAFFGERIVTHDSCPTCTFDEFGGCLAFIPNLNPDGRFNTTVINCNLNYLQSICLFNKSEPLHRLACPEGYFAPLMPKHVHNKCLSIKQFSPILVDNVTDSIIDELCRSQRAFQLNSVESTFTYERLAPQSLLSSDDRCLFGASSRKVVVNETTFISMLGLDGFKTFVNWDASMGDHYLESDTYHILSVDKKGKWFWEPQSVSCIVCEAEVEFVMPKIQLRYDWGENKLTLHLTDSEFLMIRVTNNLRFMCYAVVHTKYVANLPAVLISNGSELMYDIQIIGPGTYWCSSFVIYTTHHLQTNEVFADGIVMSMFVDYECRNDRCVNFESNFRNFLYSAKVENISIINPNVINIENITILHTDYPHGTSYVRFLFKVSVNIINEDALRTESNEINLSDEMLTYYYVRQKFLLIVRTQTSHSQFRILSVNSTNFCLPDTISVISDVNWLGARINETITSIQRCFLPNGRPLLRRCSGNTFYGAQWSRHETEQCNIEEFSDITENLQDLVVGFEDPEQSVEIIESLTNLITNSSDRLVRMDVFFVSQIMGRVTDFLPKRGLTTSELDNLVVIYNNVMQMNHMVARSSACFNSTNVLLNSLELILMTEAAGMGHDTESDLHIQNTLSVESDDRGIAKSISPMLMNFVIDPRLTEVSGIGLFKRQHSREIGENGLEDYTIRYLFRNQSWDSLLRQWNLEVASFLPQQLLVDILTTNPDAKLIFSIFYTDVLFQTTENTSYIRSGGKIIAVSIPGLDELPGILPIYVRTDNYIDDACGYWDYDDVDGWSENGCFLIDKSRSSRIVLCGCDHLTHFAYLLKGNSSRMGEIHIRSLQGITIIGCTLSLIGIAGIYITAIQFRSWRSKTSTKYLLQLSTAIAFQMILLAFVNTAPMTEYLLSTNNEIWCIVIGVLLHYFVLAMFVWMLIIAYLQFIRYVIVFNYVKTTRFLLKSSLLGWTLPMVPVLFVVIINSNTYIPDLEFSEYQICYPSGYSLYFGILLPIGVIVGANLIIFVLVNYNLLRGANAVCKAGDRNTKLSQLRLSIFLFFLLGLTWIFGLMSTAFAETSIVFSYLFCLTSSFQGFVMFLYFVIMDPVARNLWIYFFKRICFSKRGVLSDIQKEFQIGDDQGGLLQTAFVLSYMICAPVFGYLGDRYSRKFIMILGVALWSGTTLLGSFMPNYYYFLTFRALVGIGEASYSTIAPTLISDLFIHDVRSKMLAMFYFAIPVGSGLGYIIGSETAAALGSWRWALRVTPFLGVAACILIYLTKEPNRGQIEGSCNLVPTSYTEDVKELSRNRSFMLSTLGFTCVAFVTGALAWWGPSFMLLGLKMHPGNENMTLNEVAFIFGVLTMLSGVVGVPLGAYLAQRLRKRYPRADPVICGFGLLISAPCLVGSMLLVSINAPAAYSLIFIGEVALNLNWVIVADILLYVVIPTRRSTAEAFQILISHTFGDAGSPYLVGVISEAIKAVLRRLPTDSDKVVSRIESLALTAAGQNETHTEYKLFEDTNETKFKALQYALFSTCFVEILGGVFFLFTAAYILRDKAKAEKIVADSQEAETTSQPIPSNSSESS